MNIVNQALHELDIIKEPGNPVISTWISTDTHYAFIEFRNAEEANYGFRLHGMNISGSEIKIGRPKAYTGTTTQTQDEAQIPGGAANKGENDGNSPNGERQKLTKEEEEQIKLQKQMEEFKVVEFLQISLPSRFLRIGNIATFENT